MYGMSLAEAKRYLESLKSRIESTITSLVISMYLLWQIGRTLLASLNLQWYVEDLFEAAFLILLFAVSCRCYALARLRKQYIFTLELIEVINDTTNRISKFNKR